MARLLFAALLIVHGLIHVIGFLKEWKMGPSTILSGKTLFPLTTGAAKFAGIIWLFTSLLWIVAMLGFVLKKDSFWIPALIALVLSQILVVIYWQDARYGTIANIIIFVAVLVNIARVSFEKRVNNEVSALLVLRTSSREIRKESIAFLPPVVKNWLEVTRSTSVVPSNVKLIQKGAMQSKPGADWMPFDATQYYTIEPPGFLWNARIKAPGCIIIAGRDKFEDGKGNMLIKALYIYTLANASGKEIDQGTMLRYMGELVWFPEAAIKEYYQWEQIDASTAALTMTYDGTTARGVFIFDEKGLVKSFSAKRFGDFDGEVRMETWEVKVTEYSEMNDHLIATKCEVTWKLKDGDFTWLKLEVRDIAYDGNIK